MAAFLGTVTLTESSVSFDTIFNHHKSRKKNLPKGLGQIVFAVSSATQSV